MAYIPPHKRHSSSSPAPESLLPPQFRKKVSISDRNSHGRSTWKDKGSKIIYADNAISKWFVVGLPNSDKEDESSCDLSALTRFEPVSLGSFVKKSGETPLVLVLKDDPGESEDAFVEKPWFFVVENVKQDLLEAFDRVTSEILGNERDAVKPTLVARVGRVLFHGNLSSLHSWTESSLRTSKRSFYTNVPLSYMEHLTNEIVQKVGLDFEGDKELYHVKIFDNLQPDSTISCKCTVRKDCKSIELYKIELNQVRHLVVDMSFLRKSLDLRLMLNTKRIVIALTDDEEDCIKALISCAILDPDVKGGLRWPLGKDTLGGRYTIVGVWHTNAKTYRSSSFRLKVRRADRFDFRTSSGEVSGEVILKMHGVVAKMEKQTCENDKVVRLLGDDLKFIWDHLMCINK
ncbi:unnamed protein product [Cuscuta europaea]|uniref:DUF7903 domain-containing protein n=1 Tax=Cuscuta europaea TaxID=41803 RepID=A0A9P0VMK2_CUSEU|nr:unnamed protein product [Cuscuta europaea]